MLVLRFTESDDTSYTEAHVFPDPEGEPGDLLMLVNRLEGAVRCGRLVGWMDGWVGGGVGGIQLVNQAV